ncbi:MAG: DUF6252 family protein [Mucilaginibacter sp.]|uniref:DUF6252 family protein n=1 Tax=Mucilaginibacter sp. L3T2-6 TaxID=3062491 RepID=UPI002674C9FB|nr:DUF6252 family protein [Mucilaginibacter sp. L3T2-6]MDO3643340.1 DUF6252 family protein [Mucilaginibacter sp. L3T2-6]MDV6215727.1 DUF6252 family protein [Mucilaginibacter sp. L3T2-6]
MKKFSLIAILFLGILFLENCKKDTVAATATATNKMIANIKDSTWFTDTVTSSLVYNSSAKTKTFTCEGTAFNRRITISLTSGSSSNTSGFPLGTYTVDDTPNVLLAFSTPKRNNSGAIVWVPNGSVAPGSGSVVVTKVDSTKNEITGTFTFTTIVNNPDGSVSVANVTGGGFNNVPYTFTSN